MQKQYLDQVCSLISFREARPQVRRELETHYEDIVQECLAQGMSDSDARLIAEQRLGDPQKLGKQLDRAHRPQFDWSLALLSTALVIFGLIVLNSIQSSGILWDAEPVFGRTLVFTVAGISLVTGLTFFDYHRLHNYTFSAFWVILALSAAALSLAGNNEGGKQVLLVGPLVIDFIAISPFLLIICIAGIFSRFDWTWNTRNFIVSLLLLGLPNMYYLLADIPTSSAILYSGTFLILAWYSRAGWKRLMALVNVIIIPMVAGLIMEPYRMEPLLGFLYPEAYAQGAGYIYLQLQNTIQDTTLFGHGVFSLGRIPQAHTDFVFIYVVSRFGWLSGIILAGLALLLIIQLWRAASEIEEPFGQLLIIGAASLFLVQFAWSILMTLGWVPVFSIYMPFVSYGGNSFLLQMFLLGMVMSVYRRKNLDRNVDLLVTPFGK